VRIEIADVEQSTSDTKGKFAVFGVRTPKNERHMLVMPLTTASKLVTMIFNSGLIAHQALGPQQSTQVCTPMAGLTWFFDLDNFPLPPLLIPPTHDPLRNRYCS
jgi:hypothetical protein